MNLFIFGPRNTTLDPEPKTAVKVHVVIGPAPGFNSRDDKSSALRADLTWTPPSYWHVCTLLTFVTTLINSCMLATSSGVQRLVFWEGMGGAEEMRNALVKRMYSERLAQIEILYNVTCDTVTCVQSIFEAFVYSKTFDHLDILPSIYISYIFLRNK